MKVCKSCGESTIKVKADICSVCQALVHRQAVRENNPKRDRHGERGRAAERELNGRSPAKGLDA